MWTINQLLHNQLELESFLVHYFFSVRVCTGQTGQCGGTECIINQHNELQEKQVQGTDLEV